jgi:endonuclease YncB( thermonuclease family)
MTAKRQPCLYGGQRAALFLRLLCLAALVPALAAAAQTGAAEGGHRHAPAKVTRHEVLPGPVTARVLRVHDGDTLVVRARIWVGQELEIKVRLAGIDAPELRGRCPAERVLARRARDFLRNRIGAGPVRLNLIQYGKYAGRVLARVETDDGEDLAAMLIAAGLARPYDGGKRGSWCDGQQ